MVYLCWVYVWEAVLVSLKDIEYLDTTSKVLLKANKLLVSSTDL